MRDMGLISIRQDAKSIYDNSYPPTRPTSENQITSTFKAEGAKQFGGGHGQCHQALPVIMSYTKS